MLSSINLLLKKMVERGKHGAFKSMEDRMKEANGLMVMVKYAAGRSGSKYDWKGRMEDNNCYIKLMYGCGARAWYQRECHDLEVI